MSDGLLLRAAEPEREGERPPDPRRGVTFSVATMWPSAAEVVGVRACVASSWVSPSLAVPS